MARAGLYDLTLNLSADTAELLKRTKEAENAIGNYGKKMSNTISTIKTKWLAGAAAIAGGIKVLEGVLKSTQMTGDALEIKIAGLKEVGSTVAQNLANLDFSVSLRDAKKAAEEYASVLDDLGDRRRSAEMISAKNASEVAKLKGLLKDSTLSEEKRLAASTRIQEIAQEELALRKQIAEEALGGITDKNAAKYKISIEDAQSLQTYVEDYAKFGKAQQDALNDAMSAQKNLDTYLKNNSENIAKGLYREKEMSKLKEKVASSSALVNDELKKYISLWRPINDLGDEQKDEIASIVKEWYGANTAIQSYLNTAEKAENKLSKPNKKKAEGIGKVGTSNLTIPTLGPAIAPSKDLVKMNLDAANAIIEHGKALEFALEKQEKLNAAEEKQQEIFFSMASVLAQGADNYKDYAKQVKSAVKEAIGSMLAEGVALSITSALQTAKFAGPAGLFLIPGLAAMGAGLTRTAFNSLIPGFAAGGIIGGNSLSGDRVLARVNSGEMILNGGQQENLFKQINNGVGGVHRIEVGFAHGSLEGYANYNNRSKNGYR